MGILIKLNEQQTEKVLSLPESGMGYTQVICTLKDKNEIKGLVLNGENLVVDSQYENLTCDDIKDLKPCGEEQ